MFCRQGCWSALLNFVFGMDPVGAEDIAVAFDDDEAGCNRCCLVGCNPVARSVGVVDVSPFEVGPGVGIVVVGAMSRNLAGSAPGWVAERVDGGDHQ